MTTPDATTGGATFSTDVTGLDESVASTVVDVADGDTFELRIAPVVKQIGDKRVRMIAYNGSVPGPTLRVRQGSEIVVRVRNDADTEATVHWHGLRLREQVRRRARRDPGADRRSAATSPIRCASRPRPLLVRPAHPRGLRPRHGPLREPRGRARRGRTTGRP